MVQEALHTNHIHTDFGNPQTRIPRTRSVTKKEVNKVTQQPDAEGLLSLIKNITKQVGAKTVNSIRKLPEDEVIKFFLGLKPKTETIAEKKDLYENSKVLKNAILDFIVTVFGEETFKKYELRKRELKAEQQLKKAKYLREKAKIDKKDDRETEMNGRKKRYIQRQQELAPEHFDYAEITSKENYIFLNIIKESPELAENIDGWMSEMFSSEENKSTSLHQYKKRLFDKKNSYFSRKLKLSKGQKQCIQEFGTSTPNDGMDGFSKHFRDLCEAVSRELIDEMVQLANKRFKVLQTSTADDLFSGIDVIIETASGESIGIDIAVSGNAEYLNKKKKNPKFLSRDGKRSETSPQEYNAFKRQSRNKKMAREVLSIPPKLMSKILYFSLSLQAQGKNGLSLLDIYKYIVKNDHLLHDAISPQLVSILGK